MPWPLCHLGLPLGPGVEALPSALGPAGGGQDAHGRGVDGHEAAHVGVGQSAVAVGISSAGV